MFTELNRTYVLLKDYTIQAKVCQLATVLLALGHSRENRADAGREGKGVEGYAPEVDSKAIDGLLAQAQVHQGSKPHGARGVGCAGADGSPFETMATALVVGRRVARGIRNRDMRLHFSRFRLP
jgi:hypothetical protein